MSSSKAQVQGQIFVEKWVFRVRAFGIFLWDNPRPRPLGGMWVVPSPFGWRMSLPQLDGTITFTRAATMLSITLINTWMLYVKEVPRTIDWKVGRVSTHTHICIYSTCHHCIISEQDYTYQVTRTIAIPSKQSKWEFLLRYTKEFAPTIQPK